MLASDPPDYLMEIAGHPNVSVFNFRPALVAYCNREHLEKWEAAKVLTLSRRDPHYSAIGNRIIGDALFEHIRLLTESE